MKKRISIILTVLVLALVLVGCKVGRKNTAKNLQISAYDKSTETYTIKYIGSSLDFGDFYFTITKEKLTSVYCTYDASKYKLGDYAIRIGGLTNKVTVKEEVDGTKGKATLTLDQPFSLLYTEQSGDYESLNDQSIVLYVEFEDINTKHTTTQTTTAAPTTTEAQTTVTGTTTAAPTTTEAEETTTTTTQALIPSSTLKVTTSASELLVFIRNKDLKTEVK